MVRKWIKIGYDGDKINTYHIYHVFGALSYHIMCLVHTCYWHDKLKKIRYAHIHPSPSSVPFVIPSNQIHPQFMCNRLLLPTSKIVHDATVKPLIHVQQPVFLYTTLILHTWSNSYPLISSGRNWLGSKKWNQFSQLIRNKKR